jgi:hypothetical protein
MNTKYIMAVTALTIGVVAAANAAVVTDKPEYDYALNKRGTGTYNVFPVADIGNPDAKKKYEREQALEAAEAKAKERSEKSNSDKPAK